MIITEWSESFYEKTLGLLLVGALIAALILGIVQNNAEEKQATERLNPGSDVDFLPTDEGLAKGETAPDFELTTLDGETVQLSDYRAKSDSEFVGDLVSALPGRNAGYAKIL